MPKRHKKEELIANLKDFIGHEKAAKKLNRKCDSLNKMHSETLEEIATSDDEKKEMSKLQGQSELLNKSVES